MHPHMPHGNFPMPRPGMPPRGFIIPPGQAVPPPQVMMGAWPPHRAPMNHHIAQVGYIAIRISNACRALFFCQWMVWHLF